MKSIGQAGSAMPQAKLGDIERAVQLAMTFNSKGAVTKGLEQLRDATAAHEKAREDAEAAGRKAADRDKAALAAEAKATRARQALADESAEAQAAHVKRKTDADEREAAADAREDAQEAREDDLKRREALLHKAGVAGF